MANTYKNICDGTLKLIDGAATPIELTIAGLSGGVSFNSVRTRKAVMSRDVPIAWAKSGREVSEISFEVHFQEWEEKSATPGGESTSPYNFMMGDYTDAVSVGDGGDFEFDVELTIADTGATNDQAEVLTWSNCVLQEASFQEDTETNKLSFTILSLDGAPTAVRS